MARLPLLQRASHLVAYWSDGFVLYNYATAAAVRTTPLAVEILDFFGEPRTLSQARQRFPAYPAASLARVLRSLRRRGLLEVRRRGGSRQALDSWKAWNPAAGFFHQSTKNVPFVEDPSGGPAGASIARSASHVRRLKAAGIALPPTRNDGELPLVLLGRRTWRRFSRQPLPVDALATLLGLTFGMQYVVELGRGRRVHLRTSPSPGACQTLEAYVLVRRVEGLTRGLYHYAADRHELEQIGSRATLRPIPDYLPTQDWYRDAAALVFITAVFPRVWWRYDYPRAYRAVLIEAGHFCQTFLLTATWLGLAPFCSMALADSLIERDLGIDGVTESVLYAAGVGVRPPGVDWAPTPAPKRGRMSR